MLGGGGGGGGNHTLIKIWQCYKYKGWVF
jgi:hypothetical protein